MWQQQGVELERRSGGPSRRAVADGATIQQPTLHRVLAGMSEARPISGASNANQTCLEKTQT